MLCNLKRHFVSAQKVYSNLIKKIISVKLRLIYLQYKINSTLLKYNSLWFGSLSIPEIKNF